MTTAFWRCGPSICSFPAYGSFDHPATVFENHMEAIIAVPVRLNGSPRANALGLVLFHTAAGGFRKAIVHHNSVAGKTCRTPYADQRNPFRPVAHKQWQFVGDDKKLAA